MRSPAPEHPDATLAREEISRYYEDQVAEARAELAEAQALLDRREQQRLAWAERGEIEGRERGTRKARRPGVARRSRSRR